MRKDKYDQLDSHYNTGKRYDVNRVRAMVKDVIATNTWPGAELPRGEGGFANARGVFVPKPMWDEESQMPLIACRVKEAEKALGFKLMSNALWGVMGFNVYRQVIVPTLSQ
jgi:hypothetical protein